MNSEPFVIERTVNAPVERVWKAITSKEQMKEWYFDMSDFKPEVGFKFQFEGRDGDKVFVHLCEVTEVISNEKLSHTWTYDGYQGHSVLTWELFDEGEKTRIKITHAGLETFPKLPSFARTNFEQGWNDIVGRLLPEYVETGFINKIATINASAEKVWDVLTNPAHTSTWASAFSEGTAVESSWQVGSPVVWKTKDGEIGATGIVEKSEVGNLLKVSFSNSEAEASAIPLYTETYSIGEAEGKTRLSIAAGPLTHKHVKTHEPMWDLAIDGIKNLSEK